MGAERQVYFKSFSLSKITVLSVFCCTLPRYFEINTFINKYMTKNKKVLMELDRYGWSDPLNLAALVVGMFPTLSSRCTGGRTHCHSGTSLGLCPYVRGRNLDKRRLHEC